MSAQIREAALDDMPEIRAMLAEYVAWIGLDLAFQDIDAELAGLPGEYVPPRGALFVVEDGNRLVGMIGLRPLHHAGVADTAHAAACEMKRLYVRPEARGRGLARQLIDRVLVEAQSLGYDEIRLDTLPMMGDAQALYAALGFADIPAYYDTPIAGTRFMAKRFKS